MILFALALAQNVITTPPCRNGAPDCKPWERDWGEAPGFSAGAFNLVLRWGTGAPVVVHYPNRDRCELAAVMVVTMADATIDQKTGKTIEASPFVKGVNEPHAFCIPG